jgi:hypothetical protein
VAAATATDDACAARDRVSRAARRVRRARGVARLGAAAALSAAIAGCGSGGPASGATATRAQLLGYLVQVEPIRLSVNRLLERADPILEDFRKRRIAPNVASKRMDRLERSFARFTVDVAAVESDSRALAQLNAAYADTYVQEDAYLSALVSGLSSGDLRDLPNTQAQQRAQIIRWRTGLALVARKLRVPLPGDLQQAGRGEIAPSAQGAS